MSARAWIARKNGQWSAEATSGGRLVCQECRNRRAREKARRFIPRERWRKDA